MSCVSCDGIIYNLNVYCSGDPCYNTYGDDPECACQLQVGVVIGIVFGCVAGVSFLAAGIYLAWFFYKRSRRVNATIVYTNVYPNNGMAYNSYEQPLNAGSPLAIAGVPAGSPLAGTPAMMPVGAYYNYAQSTPHANFIYTGQLQQQPQQFVGIPLSSPTQRSEGPPPPQNADCILRAVELFDKAVAHDQAQEYEEAYKWYMNCIDVFATALEYDSRGASSTAVRETLRDKIKELMDRAQRIKEFLDNERATNGAYQAPTM